VNKPANRRKSLSDVLGASKSLPLGPSVVPIEERAAENEGQAIQQPSAIVHQPRPIEPIPSPAAEPVAPKPASTHEAPTIAKSPAVKLEQLNVRIDARLKLEAELIAKRQGRPMTEVISTLLEQWIAEFQASHST
jgi:hypothetical protein